jgi:polyphenol oxidase
MPVALPGGVVRVTEQRSGSTVPIYRHPHWPQRHPWIEQGITWRGEPEPFDLGLFGDTPVAQLQRRWRALREATAMPRAVHAHQVHGASVVRQGQGNPGLFIADAADGHTTRHAGILLTISVADCVPIYLLDPERRAAALLHAGWRGVAAGMLEEGITLARTEWASEPRSLELHLGPAICGGCFEVGVEVAMRLGITAGSGASPDGRLHLDLRAVLAQRAIRRGVAPERITVSSHCTRCGDAGFFSHRGGDTGRQMAFLGIRSEDS